MNEKNREIQPANRLSPSELTLKIAQANAFDPHALEANRRGRFSSNQILVSLAAVGSFIFTIVGVYLLFTFIPVGLIFLTSNSPLKAVIPFGISICIIVIFWWRGKKGRSIGFDRYAVKEMRHIPLKSLLVIDLLLRRVAEYRGPVSHDKSTGLFDMRRRDENNPERRVHSGADSSPDYVRVNYYSYKADQEIFPVSFEAYSALPGKVQDCRLYYLPLSKIMVNMEIL
jgi:hypothetical protein